MDMYSLFIVNLYLMQKTFGVKKGAAKYNRIISESEYMKRSATTRSSTILTV